MNAAFTSAFSAADPADFWDFAGTDLGSLSSGSMTTSAAAYAADNDAELLSLSVGPGRGEVTVRVRSYDTVPNSGRRIESVVTAQLRLEGGACSGSGSMWHRGTTPRNAAWTAESNRS